MLNVEFSYLMCRITLLIPLLRCNDPGLIFFKYRSELHDNSKIDVASIKYV